MKWGVLRNFRTFQFNDLNVFDSAVFSEIIKFSAGENSEHSSNTACKRTSGPVSAATYTNW